MGNSQYDETMKETPYGAENTRQWDCTPTGVGCAIQEDVPQEVTPAHRAL